MQISLLCALVSVGSFAAEAKVVHTSALSMEPISFLATAPSGVASVMDQVEKRWLEFAMQIASNNGNSTESNLTKEYAIGNFTKSCTTVSKAIVQTSAGDKSRVQVYMSNVCGQELLKGKPEELCLDFSQYLVKEMSEYQHANMEGSMELTSVCTDFLNNGYIGQYAQQERQRQAEEQAAKDAEEQRKVDEVAEAQAKAEVESKAAVARQRLEKMQNATANATATREEAVRAAVDAQRKTEESEAAVEVQKRLKVEADAAAAEATVAQEKAASLNQHMNVTNHNKTATSFLAAFPMTFS